MNLVTECENIYDKIDNLPDDQTRIVELKKGLDNCHDQNLAIIKTWLVAAKPLSQQDSELKKSYRDALQIYERKKHLNRVKHGVGL